MGTRDNFAKAAQGQGSRRKIAKHIHFDSALREMGHKAEQYSIEASGLESLKQLKEKLKAILQRVGKFDEVFPEEGTTFCTLEAIGADWKKLLANPEFVSLNLRVAPTVISHTMEKDPMRASEGIVRIIALLDAFNFPVVPESLTLEEKRTLNREACEAFIAPLIGFFEQEFPTVYINPLITSGTLIVKATAETWEAIFDHPQFKGFNIRISDNSEVPLVTPVRVRNHKPRLSN